MSDGFQVKARMRPFFLNNLTIAVYSESVIIIGHYEHLMIMNSKTIISQQKFENKYDKYRFLFFYDYFFCDRKI